MRWPQSPAEWIELLVTATASPAAPIIVDRFSAALPFLNPQISDEMAIIAGLYRSSAGWARYNTRNMDKRWNRGALRLSLGV